MVSQRPAPSKFMRRLRRLLAVLLPLAAGVTVLVLFVQNRKPPTQRDAVAEPRAVRTLEVVRRPVVPRVVGYGLVEPTRTWRGVAQVAGRIVQRAPELEDGRLLAAGELLLTIDPASYRLAVIELEARQEQLAASLVELATRRVNVEATLAIEREALQLDGKEVERQRQLLETEAGSEAAYDQQRRGYLQQQQRVQELENTLALLDPEAQRLRAQRAATAAQLESAQLDLGYTEVRAPFDCRVGDVRVELAQFVRVGDVLCDAYDVATAEVRAQVPMARLRDLVGARRGEAVEFERLASRDWVDSLGIDAVVRLRLGEGLTPSWPARLERIGGALDAQTRTLEVVVRVEDPYGQARLGERPPLVPGMYCEVELRGAAREGAILAPRSAVHAGSVYLVEAGALVYREVGIGMALGDHVVIERGLAGGEELVVSDLVPAVPGMPLEARRDADLAADLSRIAAGAGDVR